MMNKSKLPPVPIDSFVEFHKKLCLCPNNFDSFMSKSILVALDTIRLGTIIFYLWLQLKTDLIWHKLRMLSEISGATATHKKAEEDVLELDRLIGRF